MSSARIRVSNLSYSWPDGTSVFTDLSFAMGPSRAGLVAPNGAGKSTLLRVLAGELASNSGTIEIHGRLGYLSQRFVASATDTVAHFLGVADALQAVDAVLAGSADVVNFERADGHWDLRERIALQLGEFGLQDIPLQRSVETLSGGERMSVRLAAQLLRKPDVLLLDEPSNHLDQRARQHFYSALQAFQGCVLVASHDRALLEHMQQIAELRQGGLRFVGGNYSIFRAVADGEQQSAEQQVHHLRKELRRERKEMQLARERAEQRASNAARTASSAGLPRIVAGGLARSAQVSAGKAAGVHASRVDTMRAALNIAEQKAASAVLPHLALPATRVGPTQNVLSVENLQAMGPHGFLWGTRGVTLSIRGPERIALSGGNGVGKTTLLRMLAGEVEPASGVRHNGTTRTTYLSQSLDQLAPDASLMENFTRMAQRLSMQGRADILALLGFRGQRMHLPVSALSGGERMRATLACVLNADDAPQLLLLDEPTNNLDLETVLQLEGLLRGYEGAMVVASHDTAFLNAISPTRWLDLTEKGLEDR